MEFKTFECICCGKPVCTEEDNNGFGDYLCLECEDNEYKLLESEDRESRDELLVCDVCKCQFVGFFNNHVGDDGVLRCNSCFKTYEDSHRNCVDFFDYDYGDLGIDERDDIIDCENKN